MSERTESLLEFIENDRSMKIIHETTRKFHLIHLQKIWSYQQKKIDLLKSLVKHLQGSRELILERENKLKNKLQIKKNKKRSIYECSRSWFKKQSS